MTNKDSKVIVHMAASLDGFVARKDGSVDWIETKDEYADGEEMTPEFIEEFLETIGCYVMGSRTYETALNFDKQGQGWTYGDKPVYVLTSRDLETTRDTVTLHNGDLTQFINKLKSKHQSVWVVGGCELCTQCMNLGLVDEINYVILPVMIGDGIPFFDGLNMDISLHLVDEKAYTSGMVELHYQLVNESKES